MQFHPDLRWVDYANQARDSSEPFAGPLIGSAATLLVHFYCLVSFLGALRACLGSTLKLCLLKSSFPLAAGYCSLH